MGRLLCVVVVLALVVAAFVCSSVAVEPGFKATVTSSALNYASAVGLKFMQQSLGPMVIDVPMQAGKKDTIEYWVADIQISHIILPDLSISLVPGTGLQIATTGLAAELTAAWVVRESIWPHPKGEGTVTVVFSSVGATTTVKFGVSPTGDPTVQAENTEAIVGHIEMQFKGSGLAWALELLKHVIGADIKTAAQQQIAAQINTEINGALNTMLSTWPTTAAFGTVAELDYALVGPEVFTPAYMSLPLKGEVFEQKGAHVEAPFNPPAIPDPTGAGKMGQIFMSSYVVDTALYVYYKTNQFHYVANDPSISQLNTSFFAGIVPKLYSLYPNWRMQVIIDAATYPTSSFSAAQGIQANGLVDLTFQVIDPKSQAISTAFVVRMTAVADASAAVVANNITAKITGFKSSYSLLSSNIGQFDATALDGTLLFAVEGMLIPALNQYLAVGIPVPAFDGLKLVGPVVSIADGYISVVTDFAYPAAAAAASV